MNSTIIHPLSQYSKELSDSEFLKLSNFIYKNYGIKMPISKKGMLQAWLQNRLRENGMNSFKDYCDFVFNGKEGESEIVHMIDVVSTNKTDFYRESAHFDFMHSHMLPQFLQNSPGEVSKVWSSACSSGSPAGPTSRNSGAGKRSWTEWPSLTRIHSAITWTWTIL